MSQPYFTICIPVYNRQSTIIRTLDSIANQKYHDYEIIIVDDGSTDFSKEIISKWIDENPLNIVFISKENGGKHTALNRGIELAKGKFFLILDSDDWLISDNTLLEIHELCIKIEDKDEYSGVMGRCINDSTNEMMGDLFPNDEYISSYIDYHFYLPKKMKTGDCCECNKSEIIKKYRFPEPEGTKFVPEAWLFDQIGIKYKLLCTNQPFVKKEYRLDGLSADVHLKNKDHIGFLYHYISRIENIIPNTKIPFWVKIVAWWRYWQMVRIDKDKVGPRCKKIDFLGVLVWCMMPLIDLIYKIRYSSLYKAGR